MVTQPVSPAKAAEPVVANIIAASANFFTARTPTCEPSWCYRTKVCRQTPTLFALALRGERGQTHYVKLCSELNVLASAVMLGDEFSSNRSTNLESIMRVRDKNLRARVVDLSWSTHETWRRRNELKKSARLTDCSSRDASDSCLTVRWVRDHHNVLKLVRVLRDVYMDA
jgi:hypothetical protein